LASAGTRMRGFVDFCQVLEIQMRIDLGRADIGVTE
jgi:hypothetical protein